MVRGFGKRFHPTSVNDARCFSCQPDCLHPSSGQHPDSVRSDSSSQGILSKDRGSSRDIKPPNHLCRRYPHTAAGHFISTSVEQQGSRTMAPTTSRPLASLVPVKLKEEKKSDVRTESNFFSETRVAVCEPNCSARIDRKTSLMPSRSLVLAAGSQRGGWASQTRGTLMGFLLAEEAIVSLKPCRVSAVE
ncbi:hypothetical protein VFPFJ_05566 [Purpureocillium lilacinum]|uniref:Uncharacterized protein n=1 Tax=Purpureocillium lilacinum TaxID=33203 RepID=A0A179HG02_PURLI|nr:hypothetical protein VFPFJ_05566 [Purpureocillium lilacinum]OAQ89157.1 hypothetical protein VFPFJ_05566 [Purpureocillium lilacinum]